MIPRLLAGALLLACLSPIAYAQETKESDEWTITAECRMLQVPQKIAFGLIAELNDESKIDAAWERVRQMVEKGEVVELAMLVLTAGNSRKSVSETIEELPYPTEFDPPRLPAKSTRYNSVDALKAEAIIGATATHFETRNVGQTLEMEAIVLDDGNWLDVNVVPCHVRFLRWVKYDFGRLPNGERINVEQPIFHTMKNQLNLRLRNGQRVLLGVHKMPEPEKKAYELFVLHVKATRPATPK